MKKLIIIAQVMIQAQALTPSINANKPESEPMPWADCGKLDDDGRIIADFYDAEIDDVISCDEVAGLILAD